MFDNNSILLISENENVINHITESLVLLRKTDHISVSNYSQIKKVLEHSLYCVVLLHQAKSEELTLRYISTIKQAKEDCEIILVVEDIDSEFLLKAYDHGIYDYLQTTSEGFDLLIKTVNCFRARIKKEENDRYKKFLNQLGVIEDTTGFYELKYLKEIYIDISNNERIQNGTFVAITLDQATKTKISTNRLATAIKNSIRKDDIVSYAKNGKYYLILPNIDFTDTKIVIQKIQEKMGEKYKIKAGIATTGIKSFETIEKFALDSLNSAFQKDLDIVSIEKNLSTFDSWVEEETALPQKEYKLFQIAYNNKIENVITPVFYRYQKMLEEKFKDAEITQYVNNIEGVFCIKTENDKSELTIKYDGQAKIKITINHRGLSSAENSKYEVTMGKLTDKYLSSLLNQLKKEYQANHSKKRK